MPPAAPMPAAPPPTTTILRATSVLRLRCAPRIRPPWLTFVYYIACRQSVKGMTDMTKTKSTSATSARQEEHVEEIVSSIGPKVKKLRQEQRLSLQQLAVKAEVSAAAIHKIERNDMVPTITTLLKVASALDRPVTYFVERAGGQPEPAAFTPASD